ncbi:SRPBCC family protein [Anaeromyxobacter oryzae]|uniref:SRPBCC family protein n=1 Tax=Anaeromyxobacter oryzae TaxID=2918170 RepID=A0ABN6MN74_9BACT|nr:SRPBCC family protein [Anaeromyxobacter oryzae]BDG01342.1 hypothetical protein AMOR_03380 [Anaeromyxobacter oryzae]
MERIEKSVSIQAPVARAFEYLTEPAHLLAIWPSLVETTNAVVRADGGHTFDWKYKMAGLPFHGRAATIEIARDRRRVDRNEGGIPSIFTWTFAPRDGGVEVALAIEYELPVPVFGRLAAPFLRRVNEREAETLLRNLKERLEAAERAGMRETGGRPPEPAPPV